MSALTTSKDAHGREMAFMGAEQIGFMTETKMRPADMRWYWEAGRTYGYCSSRDEAVIGITGQIDFIVECKRRDAEKAAELAAMPEPVRAAQMALDAASQERDRVWGRNPFDRKAYDKAYADWFFAYLTLLAAKAEQKAVA